MAAIVVKCWGCGGDIAGPRHVIGPSPELVMCERCILRSYAETGDALQDAACVFCGEQLGRTRGWLRRRPPLRVGIRRGGQVMCEECLQLMKDIAAEWDDLEGFDDGAV